LINGWSNTLQELGAIKLKPLFWPLREPNDSYSQHRISLNSYTLIPLIESYSYDILNAEGLSKRPNLDFEI